MSDTLGPLMERNLLEVFGQLDTAHRAVAIAEIYTANCTFFESGERIVGRDALSATPLARRSSAFSRKLPDLCFARRDLLR